MAFAMDLMKEKKPSVFRYFVDLFKRIDQITGMVIDYDDSI